MSELNEEIHSMVCNCSSPEMVDLNQGTVIIYPPGNDTFLTILTLTISTIGITLSGVALALLILTAVLFAEWRRNYKNQLLIQFVTARIIYTLTRYFYDITRAFELYQRTDVTLHFHLLVFFYTEMALVFWMFVFSKQMHKSLVKVFSVQTHSIVKVSLCAWGLPVLFLAPFYLLLIVRKREGVQMYMIFIFLTKWPVLAANAVLLILVLKSILKTNQSRTGSNLRIVIVIMILIFMFCFQQFFVDIYKIIFIKVYYSTDEVTLYLGSSVVILNLLSIYNCAFSMVFWVFGNERTRKLWRSCFISDIELSPVTRLPSGK